MMKWRSNRKPYQGEINFDSYKDKFMFLLIKGEEDECWRMDIGLNIDPLEKYNHFSWRDPKTSKTKTYVARKVAYEVFVGEIPPKMMLMPTCRKLGCVNPKHIKVVTRSELWKEYNGDENEKSERS